MYIYYMDSEREREKKLSLWKKGTILNRLSLMFDS